MDMTARLWSKAWWRNALLQGAVGAIVLIAFLLLWGTIARMQADETPVDIIGLDGDDLGEICPGLRMVIHTRVIVDRPSVLVYYISVMEETGSQNIIGEQTIYYGQIHPRVADFESEMPWQVPDLPPGKYIRAVAVRDIDSQDLPEFQESAFVIGREKCNE